MAVCQNLVPLVNIKIAGKWMFIPLKMVLIGIDPYPCKLSYVLSSAARSKAESCTTAKKRNAVCWATPVLNSSGKQVNLSALGISRDPASFANLFIRKLARDLTESYLAKHLQTLRLEPKDFLKLLKLT